VAAITAAAAATGGGVEDEKREGVCLTGPPDCLSGVISSTCSSLRALSLDGCFMSTAATIAISSTCSEQLSSLSLVGCTGLNNECLGNLLLALRQLRELNVGGGSSSWQESLALAGVTWLEVLRVFRRTHLTDAQLAGVLKQNEGLRVLKLAGCYSLTDAVFEGWQQQQQEEAEHDDVTGAGIRAPVTRYNSSTSPGVSNLGSSSSSRAGGRPSGYLQGLEELTLVACDQMTGMTLSQLRRLRHLKVHGCPAITPRAVQQLLACCSKLVLLEVPGALMGGCMLPLQGPGGHLKGLKVVTEQGMPQRR
jgi:hypothetical protein